MRFATPLAAALVAFAPAAYAPAAHASEASDIIASINSFAAAMNKHDNAAIDGSFAPSPTIIDEFAPYHWSGPNALSDWHKGFSDDAEKTTVTNLQVKMSRPSFIDTDGNNALAVVPTSFSFKEQGRSQVETGTYTFVLQKIDQAWKIAGFSWTRR